MQQQRVKDYVIVGGGTAGWMTAALLAKLLRRTGANITLLESPQVSSIGVGEATVPSFLDFLQLLGISEPAFVQATDATYKLGIRFNDWLTPGHSYWHPFGNIGNKIDGQDFFQQWLRSRASGQHYAYTDFSPSAVMAQQGRFYIANPAQPNNLSHMGYALHFDATKVASYLKQFSLELGVNYVSDHVVSVTKTASGDIKQLQLHSGKALDGQFFVDCSGQKALLVGDALQVGYQSWQGYLPVNSAIVVQSKCDNAIPPYTQATAQKHGWRWQIPLQQRVGNGYVYSDTYCSDQEAQDELLGSIQTELISEPRKIQFSTGKRHKMWEKNCVAIGLSSGFLEPLESTSIYLIMRAILNLAKMLPSSPQCEATRAEYNRQMDHEYEHIRDFILLHYSTTLRTDTPFWQDCKQRQLTPGLKQKLALYKSRGMLSLADTDLFASHSWHAVLTGMGVIPFGYDPVVDGSNIDQLNELLQKIDVSLKHSVSQLLSHRHFLERIKHR